MTVSTDQPSARLRPQPGHIYVVVDLGGTQTRTAIFDPTGQMLTRRAVATPRTAGPDEVIAAVLDQIREATAQHRATVVAVGVSALGPVDPHTGIIHSAPTLPGFDNVPLGPRLHDALQLPVHVHNDANAATIAEWQLGAGRGTRNFCYVTVSTGMGCGIISNGQLVTGRAYAGELGRTRIPSTDGSTAQLEQISSGTAIAARARALIAAGTPTSLATIGRTDITAGTVAAAAAAGDHVARSIFTTAATTLGIQLANLTRLVDPETVALGGGVTLAGDIFWDPLRATIEESLAQDSIPLPRLVEAELGGDAGLHGAAIALLNHYERAPAW